MPGEVVDGGGLGTGGGGQAAVAACGLARLARPTAGTGRAAGAHRGGCDRSLRFPSATVTDGGRRTCMLQAVLPILSALAMALALLK